MPIVTHFTLRVIGDAYAITAQHNEDEFVVRCWSINPANLKDARKVLNTLATTLDVNTTQYV